MTMATDLQERLQRLARDLEDCDLFLDGLLPSGLDTPRSSRSSPEIADGGKGVAASLPPAAPTRQPARKQRAPMGPTAARPQGVPASAAAARGSCSVRQPPREAAPEAPAPAPGKRGSRHKTSATKETSVAGATSAKKSSEEIVAEVSPGVAANKSSEEAAVEVAVDVEAADISPDVRAACLEAGSAKEAAVKEQPQAIEGTGAASIPPEDLSSEKLSCQGAQTSPARCADGRARAQRHRRQRTHQTQKPPWGQPPKSVDLTRCPCEWCGEVEVAPGHSGRCKLRQVECRFCGQKLARVMREAHERSCLERPNADACAHEGESGAGVVSEVVRGPYRLGGCSSRGPSRGTSRVSSRAPSRGPSRGPSRSATPRCGSASPKSQVRSGTPLLSAENDALCAQSRARLQAEVRNCRAKLDAALQRALAHSQEAVAEQETIRELEAKLGAMSQQLSVLEWASLQAPPPDAQAQDAARKMELQGRDALDVLMELQSRLDTLEVSLEVLASNQPSSPCSVQDAGMLTRTPRSTSSRHSAQASGPSAPPPAAAKAPLPATPGGSPRQRCAVLAAGDRPHQAHAPKRLPGVLPPLGTGPGSQSSQASVASSAPPSRGRCTSADSLSAAQRGNAAHGSRSAASKPRSSTARRRCSSERRPSKSAGAEANGFPASATSLEEVDLRSAIEAERRQYIQRRLLETQDAALPRAPPRSLAADVDAGHDSQKARDLKNLKDVPRDSVSGTMEVPSVEELRLQMQREREAYISRLMPIGGSGDISAQPDFL